MARSSLMQNKFRWYQRCIDNSGIAHPHGISWDRNNTRLLISKNETKHSTKDQIMHNFALQNQRPHESLWHNEYFFRSGQQHNT